MYQHDSTRSNAPVQPSALPSAQNSTPREMAQSPQGPHTAAWVSAFAALIAALTGAAALFIR